MKTSLRASFFITLLLLQPPGVWAATMYVDLNSVTPTPPYASWNTAATNIQDAIDVATAGDLVLVTNGVYAAGGKVMFGDLTNRVVLDKAITVQSVNGPWVTTIRGAGATNGPAAVRCAWLTNGATLQGFTLAAGATRTAGDAFALRSGGGGWCASTNATVANCIIRSNTASSFGAGFFQGTLRNSYVVTNQIGPITGGAVANAKVISCTVVSNLCFGVMQTTANLSWVTNSIVYHNIQDYSGGTFAYTCAYPLASGAGNISNAPLFQVDGLHLSATSPCRGAGLSVTSGTDLSGQMWATPPSIGCVEWNPTPVVESQPVLTLTNNPGGFAISFKSDGQPPLTYYWYHDASLLTDDARITGTATTNLVARKTRPEDAGGYWVVASNSFGMVTSQVASLVMHYVNAANPTPLLPYTNWSSAAVRIQDAIEAAKAGEVVMVTNGLYNTGGKIMSGGLSNRVAIDRTITVISVNGYRDTVIEGAWDPVSTNGPMAVRGVWMTNGTTLAGFTVRNGATLTNSGGFTFASHCGGGIYAYASPSAQVYNCLLTNNVARFHGGGAFGANLWNSLILGNVAAIGSGGGLAYGELRQCTVTGNYAYSPGGGVYGDNSISGRIFARNSIIWGNSTLSPAGSADVHVISGVPLGSDLANSCFSYAFSSPPLGTNNINTTFQAFPFPFVDSAGHISINSLCRGAGDLLYGSGEDMDGEAWANPPSIGADEVVEANLIGPISVAVFASLTNTVANPNWHPVTFWASVTGLVSSIHWNFGDGVIMTNLGYTVSHNWTNPGTYTVTSTAYNIDNPEGVSATVVMQVSALIQPTLQPGLINSNGYNFSFMAQTNAYYTIRYATNLTPPITWQTLAGGIISPSGASGLAPFGIYVSPGGITAITDPAWTNATRFYRVMAW